MAIYQVLWWYEHDLLHVHDAPALWRNAKWRARAKLAEQLIAERLGIAEADVRACVDRMMGLPRWKDMQRHNPLGHGLRILTSEILRRWGNKSLEINEEAKAKLWFPGIQLPGRSENPAIDVAVTRAAIPRAVISCKWSIRHDRISDPTNECTAYKMASIQRQIMNLEYIIVTNELYLPRLDKVISQPCVDRLVHVHLPLVELLSGGLSASLSHAKADGKLLDLTKLAALTQSW